MSGGPDWELQTAIVTALRANTPLKALIGDPVRLHEVVPTPVPPDSGFPYVTIGESQRVPDFADCIPGSEMFVTLHVFSRAGGYEQAKRVIAAIDDVLDEADLTLPTHRCVEIRNDGWQTFTDQDLRTAHGVVTYRALVEPTD